MRKSARQEVYITPVKVKEDWNKIWIIALTIQGNLMLIDYNTKQKLLHYMYLQYKNVALH